MQDSSTPNKMIKFRQGAFGKLLFESFSSKSPLESYTLALLTCNTFEELRRSYRGLSPSKKQSRKCYSMNETPIPPARLELPVCWMRIDVNSWKPETRQEASLSHINGKLILIGGISRNINKDVNIYNLHDRTWEKINHNGEINEPRFGHSAVKYEGNIIIYGGGTNYDDKHKLRECLTGVHIFYLDTHKWEYLKTQGTYLPARKYHSAAMVGSHMFVYGGMNQKHNILSDSAVLNIKKCTWKAIDINGIGPGKIAFHGCASVLNPLPTGKESIYKLESDSSMIMYPGIYIFGGLSSEQIASNSLYILKLGRRPLEWISPEFSGNPPSPRFLHTTLYNPHLNLLIVFGGRVDLARTSAYTCFNDIFLLDLQSMTWLTVKVIGDVPLGRSGHTGETADCKVFIFGGVTNTSYCSGDIWMLELDSSAVHSMGELYMKKLEHDHAVETYRQKSKGAYRSNTRVLSRPLMKRFTNATIY